MKPAENVELRAFSVEADKKQELLEHLLGAEKGSFLVFVRTKHGADRVARRLARSGHAAIQIHGDRSQAQRNQALRSFSEGRHRVLVATDVAARGIDVANVAHVVNYDLPKVAEDFVHRVGRTGRASARGVASTFAGPAERNDLRKIERALSIRMTHYRVRGVNAARHARTRHRPRFSSMSDPMLHLAAIREDRCHGLVGDTGGSTAKRKSTHCSKAVRCMPIPVASPVTWTLLAELPWSSLFPSARRRFRRAAPPRLRLPAARAVEPGKLVRHDLDAIPIATSEMHSVALRPPLVAYLPVPK